MFDPRAYVRVIRELHEGAKGAIAARFDPPAASARVHRFVHGFALPFSVARVVARDPKERKKWLEVLAIELALLVPLAIVMASFADDVDEGLSKDWKTATLAVIVAFWFALGIVEWGLIALAHEFHDALAFDVSVATYVPGEPLARPPRARLDTKWLWTKAKRKVRGIFFVVSAAPLLALARFVPVVGDVAFVVLTFTWAAYWASVFALGNTHLAWEHENDAPDPWFLRALDAVGHVPLFGWFARIYARILRRFTKPVHSACMVFEEAPYEAAGLALARVVAGIPGVWLALRPFFGPAATHALLGARYAQGTLKPASPVNPV